MGVFFRVVIRVHYRYSRPRGGVNCLNSREVTSVTPRTRITTMNVVECSRDMFLFSTYKRVHVISVVLCSSYWPRLSDNGPFGLYTVFVRILSENVASVSTRQGTGPRLVLRCPRGPMFCKLHKLY